LIIILIFILKAAGLMASLTFRNQKKQFSGNQERLKDKWGIPENSHKGKSLMFTKN
jgi:hypothetical protein